MSEEVLKQFRTLIQSVQYTSQMPEQLKSKVASKLQYYFTHYAPDIKCPYDVNLSEDASKKEYLPLAIQYIEKAI